MHRLIYDWNHHLASINQPPSDRIEYDSYGTSFLNSWPTVQPSQTSFVAVGATKNRKEGGGGGGVTRSRILSVSGLICRQTMFIFSFLRKFNHLINSFSFAGYGWKWINLVYPLTFLTGSSLGNQIRLHLIKYLYVKWFEHLNVSLFITSTIE